MQPPKKFKLNGREIENAVWVEWDSTGDMFDSGRYWPCGKGGIRLFSSMNSPHLFIDWEDKLYHLEGGSVNGKEISYPNKICIEIGLDVA